MPPAFNLSQDQTLQFKFGCRFEGDKSLLGDYCRFGFRTKSGRLTLSPKFWLHRNLIDVSAHTSYLIDLLKNLPDSVARRKRSYCTEPLGLVNTLRCRPRYAGPALQPRAAHYTHRFRPVNTPLKNFSGRPGQTENEILAPDNDFVAPAEEPGPRHDSPMSNSADTGSPSLDNRQRELSGRWHDFEVPALRYAPAGTTAAG